MKIIKLSIATSYLFFVQTVYAQIGLSKDPNRQPGEIKIKNAADSGEILGTVFQNILVLLFTVGALGFIIMFVWGTVDWILSGGDKEKIAGARKRIVTAITGLVLLALTFVITIIVGQVLGLCSLRHFIFPIPQLINPNNELCKAPGS